MFPISTTALHTLDTFILTVILTSKRETECNNADQTVGVDSPYLCHIKTIETSTEGEFLFRPVKTWRLHVDLPLCIPTRNSIL